MPDLFRRNLRSAIAFALSGLALFGLPGTGYAQSTEFRTTISAVSEPLPENLLRPTITEEQPSSSETIGSTQSQPSASQNTEAEVGASDPLFSGPIDPDTQDTPDLRRRSNGDGARINFSQDGDIRLGRRANNRGRSESSNQAAAAGQANDPQSADGQTSDGNLEDEGRFFNTRNSEVDADLRESYDNDLQIEPLVPAEEALTGPTVGAARLLRRRDNLLRQPGDPFAEPDRRAADRYAEENPYEPLGLRAGSFILRPTISATTIVTDNVFNGAGGAEADVGVELRPTLRLESNWNRHAVSLDADATAVFYNRFHSENTTDYSIVLRSRLDITHRTNVELDAGYRVEAEGRGSAEATLGAVEQPDVATIEGGITLNHRFNRLVSRTRVGYTQELNGDATLADGSVTPGSDEDYSRYEVAQRATWEFSPSFAAFVEGAYNWQQFDVTTGGVSRDSEGYEARLGVTTEIGPTIRAEVSAGYAVQMADDTQTSDVDGLVLDANATWRPTALTTLTLTGQTELNTTSSSGASSILEYETALNIRHEFRRYAIGTLGFGWRHQDYQGVDLTEDELTFQVGGEYILSRELAAVASYQFTDFTSSLPASDYAVNELRIGIQVRR